MRDWSFEHTKRKATKKRLLAEIEKDMAGRFLACLQVQGVTYSEWLKEAIRAELDAKGGPL
jgi:hypothetical protein